MPILLIGSRVGRSDSIESSVENMIERPGAVIAFDGYENAAKVPCEDWAPIGDTEDHALILKVHNPNPFNVHVSVRIEGEAVRNPVQ